jgi:hypothetical protein
MFKCTGIGIDTTKNPWYRSGILPGASCEDDNRVRECVKLS